MYTTILFLHSILRWAVLAAGVFAVVRAVSGWRAGRPWTLADDRASLWYTIALDLQMLLGLLLYFWLSPITTAALREFGGVMGNSSLRFWVIEHPFGMFVAIAVAHIGRGRLRKVAADARRHRTAAIFFGISLLIILLTIPWPGGVNGRPLFRW